MSATQAVLVTGASTGIGRAIVEQLAAEGNRVFAAVRDLSDATTHPLVTPVRLDVTSANEALHAASTVRESLLGMPLRGIVNNAGVAVGGPLEFVELDELRRQLEVNVVGQLAVTQAFLPLLRDSGVPDPRIVFMGSISSRIALPLLGPYAISKFGVRAMAEALRRELRGWGFKVSVVEPGVVATPIWDKGMADIDASEATMPPHARTLYRPFTTATRKAMTSGPDVGMPPSKIADVVSKALFDKRPRAEYVVGADAKMGSAVSAVLPTAVMDRLIDSGFRRRADG